MRKGLEARMNTKAWKLLFKLRNNIPLEGDVALAKQELEALVDDEVQPVGLEALHGERYCRMAVAPPAYRGSPRADGGDSRRRASDTAEFGERR